jgi:uncharacterized caspase-like protein
MKIIFLICFGMLPASLTAQTLIIKAKSDQVTYAITQDNSSQSVTIGAEENKYALVIGNKDYKVGPLPNATNDANDLAELLKQKNFTVEKVINGTRLEIRNAIRDFSNKIASGGVGLFYYSGHGVQVDGDNYLVPIDADYDYKEEVPDVCVNVSYILRSMEASNNRLNILILDACRNSPFKSFSRSGEKGMVRLEAPTGSIIAYSTAPGRTASDGTGRNGLYTSKLMKYMNVPGMKIEDIFKQVRIEVTKESNQMQIPWESNSLMGDFYFTGQTYNATDH